MGKNLFNSIKLTKPRTNHFDLTHDVKLSTNMGWLTPIMCTECVPGDRFKIGCEALIRFAPMLAPVMHRVDVSMHYFFVPNRILWKGWEYFITQQPDPVTDLVPAFPYVDIDDTNGASPLVDYLGIPTPIAAAPAERVSALPFAAYTKIYNDYYRDQNLIPDVIGGDGYPLNDGNNTPRFNAGNISQLRIRAWEHDYFTASLPFAQKGAPVDIPLGDVVLKPLTDTTSPGRLVRADTRGSLTGTVTSTPSQVEVGTGVPAVYDPQGTLEAGSTTINDLRRAFRLQEWLEKNARGGTRYIENILAHFGVRSSDKRLQRPEYITGTKSPVVISEVLNTTGPDPDQPQGTMSGHGVSVTAGKYGSYFCEEHGYIMGIMSVMPRTAYQQGIPKHFLKTGSAFDYFFPEFANIGEQEVQAREVYAFQGAGGNDTFGYVPRYAEYKFEQNRVAGAFRSTLAFWHWGRIFATPPSLNQEFVECVPRNDPFAVIDDAEQHIWCQVLNKISAVRPMPKFGTPQF